MLSKGRVLVFFFDGEVRHPLRKQAPALLRSNASRGEELLRPAVCGFPALKERLLVRARIEVVDTTHCALKMRRAVSALALALTAQPPRASQSAA